VENKIIRDSINLIEHNKNSVEKH